MSISPTAAAAAGASSTPTSTAAMMTDKKAAVCVTGANGFIGTYLVKTLIESGYTTIHCSIFPNSSSSHLFSLFPSASIRIFEADILDYDAVSRAVEGCHGVFHVASPCTLEDPRDPQAELVDPAVKGTQNVLEASKNHGVRRVVLTSSISAMVPNFAWPTSLPVDESCWTDINYCRSHQLHCRRLPSFCVVLSFPCAVQLVVRSPLQPAARSLLPLRRSTQTNQCRCSVLTPPSTAAAHAAAHSSAPGHCLLSSPRALTCL
ncbi:cinnamoyl-CoA reductase 1-like isoform X2 [Spinacia oleracea]|uniref:Cinnamoyl-CoA reductase 1-like isoform X2 n=1 Tax=Spinacia oleracea TaxID=3562 RepID=A0ABM3R307_SPIOL|nr:cinnamoyl-CoA reductase 1-like isoform X2 [Spinacia oleracea]